MSGKLLEMAGVSKTFPGVKALDSVDFSVRPGEIHALMGENGAGKSTLIKVLTGVHSMDSGTVRLNGRPISPAAPIEAEAAGISTVYQEVNLIPHLSIAENIALGRQPVKWGLIDWKAARRRAEAALARLDLKLDVSRELCTCSVAIQQMVAIARAVDLDARLLILDEPTASLDEQEVDELFTVMDRLRGDGLGIVFVTHFLDQVYRITDRITVLRNGSLVGEYETARLPRLELIARMLGKDAAEVSHLEPSPADHTSSSTDEAFFRAENLGRTGSVAPFDLTLRRGETLGFAGLLGSGRTEAVRLLFGADRATSGRVSIDGKTAALNSPRQAIAAGLAFCPEDRKTEGLVLELSVRDNIILAMQARQGVLRAIPRAKQDALARHYITALNIKTPGPDTPVRSLSGGNQQKVLLARWLAIQPRVIILDEPTRGIDVGAKGEIEKLVTSLRDDGMSVVFISSELEEVIRTCQRVMVMRDRRMIGELEGPAITEPTIMEMIAKTHE